MERENLNNNLRKLRDSIRILKADIAWVSLERTAFRPGKNPLSSIDRYDINKIRNEHGRILDLSRRLQLEIEERGKRTPIDGTVEEWRQKLWEMETEIAILEIPKDI